MAIIRHLTRAFPVGARKFCTDPISSITLEQGVFLNRFAGLADASSVEILEDTSDLEMEDLGSQSHVSHIQRAKTVIRGGEDALRVKSDISESRSRRSRGFRSKLSEERYKLSHMIFDGDVRVRIMDVDRFDLNELHQYFIYTLVRHFPAEDCVRVASRIAVFRDKYSQHSFESLSADMLALFGPVHGPELSALFARCYGTIPVPFMLDYIRRFGKFSKKFIAQEVEKTISPRTFDFVRYVGGVKPLPGFVARPFALRSFARMLPPCAAKRYIFQHLIAVSGSGLSGSDMDPQTPAYVRLAERVHHSQLSEIESGVYTRQPVAPDEIISALVNITTPSNVDAFESQFTHVQKFNDDCNSIEEYSDPNNTQEERLVGGWWEQREHSREFFRYNKKAYRLNEDGWKQVEDPRGPKPDYTRTKNLRNSKIKLEKQYARLRRKTQRETTAKRIATLKINS